MTSPTQADVPLDAALAGRHAVWNTDLSKVAAHPLGPWIVTAVLSTPQGQRMALTIRTATTTLTVMLQGPDARNWARQFTATAESMSVAGLVIANGHLP